VVFLPLAAFALVGYQLIAVRGTFTPSQPASSAGRPLSVEATRRLVQDYLSWEVVVSTLESVIQALDIEVHHKISFWDALIVQAAERSGATILYSEDLATGQRYGSLRVVNPLADSVSPSPVQATS